jgi:hypothetical protein
LTATPGSAARVERSMTPPAAILHVL